MPEYKVYSRFRNTFQALFCPYLRHYYHRIYDAGGPEELITGNLYPEPDRINPVDDREYGELFRRWSPVWKGCGSTLGIFEYGGNFPDETRRFDFTRYLYKCQNARLKIHLKSQIKRKK